MIQELFIANQEIWDSWWNFYCLLKEKKEIWVMSAVWRDLENGSIVDDRIDLVNHLYIFLLEICGLNLQSKKPGKKTRVVKLYDNRVWPQGTWNGNIQRIIRTLEHVDGEKIVRGRMLIAGDIYAHNPACNHHCERRANASTLKKLKDKFSILIHNKLGRAPRCRRQVTAVINIALSTTKHSLFP